MSMSMNQEPRHNTKDPRSKAKLKFQSQIVKESMNRSTDYRLYKSGSHSKAQAIYFKQWRRD
jgi:hypothetical protein